MPSQLASWSAGPTYHLVLIYFSQLVLHRYGLEVLKFLKCSDCIPLLSCREDFLSQFSLGCVAGGPISDRDLIQCGKYVVWVSLSVEAAFIKKTADGVAVQPATLVGEDTIRYWYGSCCESNSRLCVLLRSWRTALDTWEPRISVPEGFKACKRLLKILAGCTIESHYCGVLRSGRQDHQHYLMYRGSVYT